MAYPYDQGVPPGYGQPGLFGATLGGFGFGAGSQQEQQAYTGMGANLAGSGVVGAMSATPAAIGMGVGTASLFAPMLMPGFQSASRLAAGHQGIMATGSMRGALGYGAMKAIDTMDPFSHVMSMGARGGRAGFGLGSRMFGTQAASRIAGGAMPAIGRAFAHGGMRAGVGMLGRFGGAAAMGGAGALTAAAAPLALGLAAYQGLEYTGQQLYQGASDTMQGQALMNELGPSVAPGQNMRNEGATTGRMMREMASDLGTGTEDIGRFAKQLNSQRVFQTTRNAKEFRDKFKEVMGAVKEIAKITQGSVDDAMKMFTDLRQQGFYTTADVKAQAASRQAREMTTGISAGVYSAVGGAGAQMARQYGMRGRFGSRLAERNVAGVAMGVRSGAMSEEEVNELGGVEAVGMRMAQQQMGFMRSARGRAMIAYAMGEGGAPDSDRLNRMMRGTSMEDIVTGAAGRGLGVLRAAGGREARENFAPYAGMAMVQMAASQQRQLHGGISQRGIIGMLGTMGVGREEANLMLQQTMQMPQQLRAEQEAIAAQRQQQRVSEIRDQYSLTGQVGGFIDRTAGSTLRGIGRNVFGSVSGSYSRAMQGLTGGEEYTGGDDALARRFLAEGGGTPGLGRGRAENRQLFGMASASRRIEDQYGEFVQTQGQLGLSDDRLQRALQDGDLQNLGGGRFVRRRDVEQAEAGFRRGMQEGAGEEATARLRSAFSGGGDFTARMRASRRDQLGEAMGTAGTIGGAAMNLGLDRLTSLAGRMTGGMLGGDDLSTVRRFHDEFFLAQEAGLVDRDMTLRDFMAKPTQERMKITGQAMAALRESAAKGDRGAREMLEHMGQKEGGLLATRDIQAARDDFESQISRKFNAKFGRTFGGLRGFGSQEGLSQKLTTSGKARQAYDAYVQAVANGESEQEIMRLQDSLRDELGGEDSEEFKAAVDQKRQLEGMSKEERKQFANETSQLFGERAYLEKVHRDTEGLKRRISGIDLDELKSPELKRAIETMTGGDLKDRQRGMEQLILGSITGARGRGEGIISAEERDILNRVGGAGQGESIAQMVEGLRTGRGGATKELGAMKDREGKSVFKEGELEAIKDISNPEKQAQAIAEALKRAGLTDVAAFREAAGSGKDIRGIQTEYVEANEKFVTSVWAFVSALESAGIEVPGPAKQNLDSAAGDVTGGGNSGGGFFGGLFG
jgi:hypothetical protein